MIILFPEAVLTLPGAFLSKTVLGASLLFVRDYMDEQQYEEISLSSFSPESRPRA